MAGISVPRQEGIKKSDESLAILRSRVFLTKFIQDEDLMPVLFEDAWDNENNRWIAGSDGAPSEGSAYRLFHEMIGIDKERETGLITLSLDWRDAERAAQWVNALVRKLNGYVKEQQVREAQRNMEFLQKQLSTTNIAENRAILYDLIKSNTKTIMLANVTDEFAFKILDPAVVPEQKIKPKRKQMVMIGGSLGLFLGIGLAFVVNYIQELKRSGNETRSGNEAV